MSGEVNDELLYWSRHYYFWFFGYVAKLPYERELLPAALSPGGTCCASLSA